MNNANNSYSQKLLHYKPVIRKPKTVKKEMRILRIICQRPYFTGSGINFINLSQKAKEHNIAQAFIFGHPSGTKNPFAEKLDLAKTFPVHFKNSSFKNRKIKADIDFPVAGMSDRMPYSSTRFSDFSDFMLENYLSAFAKKIKKAVNSFNPTILHSHHLWLVSALVRVLNPTIPMITTCHNTALRQLELAPHLKPYVLNAIRDIDVITVNNYEQAENVKNLYNFPSNKDFSERFFNVGQGINSKVFCPPSKQEYEKRLPGNHSEKIKKLIYVGKLCNSKGLPQLIQAFKEICAETNYQCKLFIAGSGCGQEKDKIVQSTEYLKNQIIFLGQLDQQELATRFRKSDIFILPSFYEGFPKVLLEALACGCKAIITDLPGIRKSVQKNCPDKNNINFIPLPKMKSCDKPCDEALPDFVAKLKLNILQLLQRPDIHQKNLEFANCIRQKYGWEELFQKYLKAYNLVLSF